MRGTLFPLFSFMDEGNGLLIITSDSALRGWFEEFVRRYPDIGPMASSEFQDVEARTAEVKPQAVVVYIPPPSRIDIQLFERIRRCDPFLPIITIIDGGDRVSRIQSLRLGAYAAMELPLAEEDEIYSILRNAAGSYRERREAARSVAEMKSKLEADRLNLLELELVKGLQRMIGETDEPVSILKHAFSLMKGYLVFDVFAALVQRRGEAEIHIYPSAPIGGDLAEIIPGTLMKRMNILAGEGERKIRLVMEEGGMTPGEALSDDLRSVIVPLVTAVKTCGYAGMYRDRPFAYEEEAVFKRFCAHVATALEKISLFEEIRVLSTNDGLTGLFNHVSIKSRLEQEMQRSQRYGSPLSAVVFDIDDFKEINDRFGHLAGDAVLAELSKMLRAGVRSIDSVGRLGGEEFLVVLPETDGHAATLIGDRLRQSLSNHIFRCDDKEITVSISGGVGCLRDDKDVEGLIGMADENLYRAKREGKNMVYYGEDR